MQLNKAVLKSTKAKISILAIGLLAASSVGTMALLTDSAKTDITITSASLALTVNENANASTYNVSINTTNMKPTDSRAGAITIKNDSSIPATISMTKNTPTGFVATVKDDLAKDFTEVTLGKGESKVLTLNVSIPESVTTPPATQTLNVTFNSKQA